ncbi:protealysin inhibitor emfourin [Microbacterium sp. NPDC076911]|uniref:protealysin inhibitor emfourin n=1 Tax=Microbacterium sp. NPDC076911 TaxID=3154958 RepID=UPI00343DDCBB
MMSQSPIEPSEIRVSVTRTGGFAGLSRQWHVTAANEDASKLASLVEQCPWAETQREADDTTQVRTADRFVWLVHAQCSGTPDKQAVVPEAEATGAWRSLIDAVRSSDGSERR